MLEPLSFLFFSRETIIVERLREKLRKDKRKREIRKEMRKKKGVSEDEENNKERKVEGNDSSILIRRESQISRL